MARVRFWLTAAVLGVAGAFTINSATREPAVVYTPAMQIEVDLSRRELAVIEDGEVTRRYPVAVGKPSYPTPEGSFAIRRIIWNPRWVPPDSKWAADKTPKEPGDPANPMGKVKIFFSEPDYYIHGTRETDSLGEAESHGCIRMRNSDAVALAGQIMAAGGKPVPQSWVRRLLNKVRSTREVRLSDPVSITIAA